MHKQLNTLLIFLILTISSCKNGKKAVVVKNDIMGYAVPNNSDIHYFSKDSTSNENTLQQWGNKVLFFAKEPLLREPLPRGNYIRLLWMRPFESSIIVRVNKINDTLYVNLKEVNIDRFKYSLIEILKDTIIKIQPVQLSMLFSNLNNINFWKMPYENVS